ncbi:serine/threonine protein kinase RIO2 [Plasmodium brasilianum]|uniref:Serine/threonine-protein kinase RIO2 n=2 Tax=Plasmodium (Plasmodium) TaxID=418103 RepID=A0A1A8VW90_PLAMA|nr:serine/threonine protein kinase RIO2, putative [Plasmodium malariae]KAI4840154.1 serine/threonine protein kinase RIO2 [Plasmodium brasilianum]SBS83103.1 serine/threonine protein kinase RIO2, putative (RIO2) [Plasmodium malariae]SBT87514.1 serine/threonine protein kinase RIO2, putative [Plasmodium malariae]
MKLDISCFCFLSRNEYRVLTAIEMGMRNHEYLPVSLIASIANLRKEGITSVLKKLLKNKLISHENRTYDGYKLTYLGYDFLALRAFLNRGILKSVGNQIGVGKESDIYICKDINDNLLCLKIHRLGRISFRTIKNNRDYYGKKKFRNWLYLSKIAATKEYTYLKALYENNFPVPKPYDLNRHMILMSYINGYPLSHVKISNPFKVIDFLINTIIKFAKADIIHGDFNEFNILIDDDENITIIDFPQIVSLHHENGKTYFERDVKCVINHFFRKYKIKIEDYPLYEDVIGLTNHKIVSEEVNVSVNEDDMLLQILQNDKSYSCSSYSEGNANCFVQYEDGYSSLGSVEEEEVQEEEEKEKEEEGEDEDEIRKDKERNPEKYGSGKSQTDEGDKTNGEDKTTEEYDISWKDYLDKLHIARTMKKEVDKLGENNTPSFHSPQISEGDFKDAYECTNDKEEENIKIEKREDNIDEDFSKGSCESQEKVFELTTEERGIPEQMKKAKGDYTQEVEKVPTEKRTCEVDEGSYERGDSCDDDKCYYGKCENDICQANDIHIIDEVDKGEEQNDEKINKFVQEEEGSKTKEQISQTEDYDERSSYSDNISLSTNDCDESSITEYSSCDSHNSLSEDTTKKLSDTWKPHIKKYTKEYVKSKLKYMHRKKKSREKYKENLKTKNKKKVMEKIKNYL